MRSPENRPESNLRLSRFSVPARVNLSVVAELQIDSRIIDRLRMGLYYLQRFPPLWPPFNRKHESPRILFRRDVRSSSRNTNCHTQKPRLRTSEKKKISEHKNSHLKCNLNNFMHLSSKLSNFFILSRDIIYEHDNELECSLLPKWQS